MEKYENSTINNRYKILEKLNSGASAIVYLVEKKDNNKKYAAKVLNEVTPLFEKEKAILECIAKKKSPYLVNLIDCGKGPVKIGSKQPETKQYFILDYASKGDLYEYIAFPEKDLKEIYAKLIFRKILEGVQALHTSGICHRDLKMENILLDGGFNPKICDFGYACEIKGEDESGKLKEYIGTPSYAAPELFLHRPYEGVKADIFSLGATLIKLVNPKICFDHAHKNDKLYKFIILRDSVGYWNNVRSEMGEISEELQKLYIDMVSFNPDERPSIEDIFKSPWMKEVMDMNEEELKKLEEKMIKNFEKREKVVIACREVLKAESMDELNIGGNKSSVDEKEYFTSDINPKYYQKTGFNMKNYLKIIGNLKPVKFMNSLANKIKDICTIEADKEKLKFKAIFESEEEEKEEENEEEKKKIEEEFKKLGLEDTDNYEDTIEKKDSVIQIKLLQSMNGGYLIKFEKKGGEIEDYYKNLKNIIEIIKQII